MSEQGLFPPRAKLFTLSGNLTPAAHATLKHIQTKHPPMTPSTPPLTTEERKWLEGFIEEWAQRLERGLLSRKLLKKYGPGKGGKR